MGTFYVSSLAAGGGTGAIGSPWTLAEGISGAWFNTIYVKADGVYTRSTAIAQGNNSPAMFGYGTTPGDGTKATIRLTADLASASTYFAVATNDSVLFGSLTFDLNGKVGSGVNLGGGGSGHNLIDSEVKGLIGASVGVFGNTTDWVLRTVVTHGGTGTCFSTYKCRQVCAKGGGTGVSVINNYGGVCLASVAIGCTTGFTANGSADAGPDQCLAINCTTGFSGSANTPRTYHKNYAINCTTAQSGNSSGTVRTLSASMFTNPNTGDLRLTASGKADNEVRALMIALFGTPGITTDSLADLFAGGLPLPLGQVGGLQ